MKVSAHKNSNISGFTLIELSIVIAISVSISLLVLGTNSNFYAGRSLTSERDSVVSLLRRARAKAMNNIHQSNHGFYVDVEEYVVFEGDSYITRDEDFDEYFPRISGVQASGLSEIVFSAIEGASNASGTVTLSRPSGVAQIPINYKGRVSW